MPRLTADWLVMITTLIPASVRRANERKLRPAFDIIGRIDIDDAVAVEENGGNVHSSNLKGKNSSCPQLGRIHFPLSLEP